MAILPDLSKKFPPFEVVVMSSPDGDLDKISIEGGRHQEDYYPDGPVKYIAFSDGTLLRYQEDSRRKLHVLRIGKSYKHTERDSKSPNVIVMRDDFEWVVYGVRY